MNFWKNYKSGQNIMNHKLPIPSPPPTHIIVFTRIVTFICVIETSKIVVKWVGQ